MRLLFSRAHLLFTGGRSLDSICAWYHPGLNKNISYEEQWVSFIGLEYVKNLLNRDVLPFQNRHHFFLPRRNLWILVFHTSSVTCFPGQQPPQGLLVMRGVPRPVFCGVLPGRTPGEDSRRGWPPWWLTPARAWAQNCEFLEGLRIPSPCWPDIFFPPGNTSPVKT